MKVGQSSFRLFDKDCSEEKLIHTRNRKKGYKFSS